MGVSTTFSPPRRKRASITLRVVIFLLAFVLLLFVAADVWFFRASKASLPMVDGTAKLSGLNAAVIVTRDSLGVPNISAQNLHDLFFAQGFVTAQDRLWQMDMTRRYASGDLSAILGPEYVATDKEQRILGLRQVAEKAVAGMAPEDRARLQAYADGVNAYIQLHQKTLPLEFRLMTYFPYEWTVEDSMLVGLSMTEFLNHYMYKKELQREKILAQLGPELTADLYVNSSWRDHPPGQEGQSIEQEAPTGDNPDQEEEEAPAKPGKAAPPNRKAAPPSKRPSKNKTGQLMQLDGKQVLRSAQDDKVVTAGGLGKLAPLALIPGAEISDGDLRPGSNNWVVSGAHTITGKPMLSNDMHLDLRIPNTWYEAHLTAGDYDVVGVTLPGMPFVIVGHNQHIAWGFTNLGPNVEDLYVEKFNDRGEYLTPQGWKQPEHRKEIIRVKGKPEVDLDVSITRHGPVITPIVPGETRQIALKWTIYDSDGNIPFFQLNSARNWEEFRAAFANFAAPGQNVVYADNEGNIGYQATGRVPIRAGDGALPVPGDDDTHEWTGYVAYDKMPSVYNPPSGIIATANARVTPQDYPYTLAIEWSAPYRVQRIYKLLGANKKYTAADMLNIQTDVVSEIDRFCAQRFVYAVDHTPKASSRAKAAADLMRNWDGSMATDLAAPTIAYYSRAALEELLLKAKLGDNWKTYRWFMKPVWLENVLINQPSRWLPSQYANYDALLTAAVESALSQEQAPTALSTWRWGRVHMVDVKHPFWSNIPVLKRAGPGPQPLSGDEQTIKQVQTHFGPSERFTADMSDLDHSTLDIVNGQSGNIFDEHFNDQWDAYYNGRTFPLPFSTRAVQEAGKHHLRLEPQ